jgi:hypothetical protein
MDWTADAKSVFATGWTADEIPVVLGVEPNGNHRVMLEGETAAPFWWAIRSPDGRYLALQVVTREGQRLDGRELLSYVRQAQKTGATVDAPECSRTWNSLVR